MLGKNRNMDGKLFYNIAKTSTFVVYLCYAACWVNVTRRGMGLLHENGRVKFP